MTEEFHIDGTVTDEESPETPDFAALYDSTDQTDNDGYPLATLPSPRQAFAIWLQAQVIADLEFVESDPLNSMIIERLPASIAQAATADWLLRFQQSFIDLAIRLATGELPLALCTGDELALHFVVEDAAAWIVEMADDFPEFLALPRSPLDKPGWEQDAIEELLEDQDVLWLFDGRLDGIDDDQEIQQRLGVANLRPDRWFLPFRP